MFESATFTNIHPQNGVKNREFQTNFTLTKKPSLRVEGPMGRPALLGSRFAGPWYREVLIPPRELPPRVAIADSTPPAKVLHK